VYSGTVPRGVFKALGIGIKKAQEFTSLELSNR